ncbi:MAG TPA: YiiD C-terminal domain-containing protein [Xanthomonadaceae bacterium]|nr:YiiD C-terminal domain-containing protein [Xanthomonadaceae bacterium]
MNAAALEAFILEHIPLTRAISLRVLDADAESLTLGAPLGPNVNDKGCAFGGSLASLLTLAGWGLVRLRLGEAADDSEIYVQDSVLRYSAPVWSDLRVRARLAEGESWQHFRQAFASRGRARVQLIATALLDDGSAATTLEARFAAFRRQESRDVA